MDGLLWFNSTKSFGIINNLRFPEEPNVLFYHGDCHTDCRRTTFNAPEYSI